MGSAVPVYNKIRDLVNSYKATYRLSIQPVQVVSAGDRERHWGAVERCFSDRSLNPSNIFVIDFNKPRGAADTAYPVIKQILTKAVSFHNSSILIPMIMVIHSN